ncbi:iron chelate uptake ABC transporter family permease subunit [Vibrio aerogenes]|nr:iron chelate uptake ABC transporter family permease subunit [Vibrio aerogenes]
MLKPTLIVCMGILVIGLSWMSIVSFSVLPLPWHVPVQMLLHGMSGTMTEMLIADIRFPRVLAAIITGAGFSVAGVLMQTLTRNPLASPGLFGVNAGAALGVALVSGIWPQVSSVTLPVAAIAGAGFAWGLVMVLGRSWRGGSESRQLVLAGIAVSALCGSMTKASLILAENQATPVLTWLAGSYAGIDWQTVFWSGPLLLLLLVIAFMFAPSLNLLRLGDERAKSLGVRLKLIRYAVNALVLALVGVCISSVGSIAFVGLTGPHIARFLFGHDHRWLMAGAALTGAILTVSADILSRAVIFPAETPAGAVLALVGAPCFIYLVRKKKS